MTKIMTVHLFAVFYLPVLTKWALGRKILNGKVSLNYVHLPGTIVLFSNAKALGIGNLYSDANIRDQTSLKNFLKVDAKLTSLQFL